MDSSVLRRYRVLLVGTKIPENVGAVARLLENFGVGEAGLVAPKCEWREGVAQWLATNSSRARLNALPVHTSLREAVADCASVVGFTARAGKRRRSVLKLEDLARQTGGRVALVFGREDFCLLKDEIEVCTHLCALDTNPAFPALNLSHSVAVALSSIYRQETGSRLGHHRVATSAELEPLFDHLFEMLQTLGYRGEGNPGRVLSKLKKVYQRAGLTRNEIQILRGICSKTVGSVREELSPDREGSRRG
jgi:TrmH family RNA methyltransferase